MTKENEKSLVFDIQRFSTKDGPGIRTVVYFKGCNMRCFWCHNPEGIHFYQEMMIDPLKCFGCMACADVCPVDAHIFSNQNHTIDIEKCQKCFDCVRECHYDSLKLVGAFMDFDTILEEILEDKIFYDNSGGGVTLSGGEVMMQMGAAIKILKECQSFGIHTAIETNLSFPWKKYEEILPFVDLVMTDIKHIDDDKHRLGTGISNKIILENIKHLSQSGLRFIVRTPVIPGFNDSKDTISKIAQFLSTSQSLEYYELLSYNPLGNAKGQLVEKLCFCKSVFNEQTKEDLLILAKDASQFNVPLHVDGYEF